MFEGTYATPREAHTALGPTGNLFEQSTWTETVWAGAAAAKERMASRDHSCEWYERELLGILATELHRKEQVAVLDFAAVLPRRSPTSTASCRL